MKAILMAFGNNCGDVCGCVQSILKSKEATLIRSGEEVVGGRPCFAVIAEFGNGNDLKSLQNTLKSEGEPLGLEIKVMRPDMFLAMHRIAPAPLEPIT